MKDRFNGIKAVSVSYESRDIDPIKTISDDDATRLRLNIINAIASQKGDIYGKGVSHFSIQNDMSEIYGSFSLEHDSNQVFSIDILSHDLTELKDCIGTIFDNDEVAKDIYEFLSDRVRKEELKKFSAKFKYSHISGYAYVIDFTLLRDVKAENIYSMNYEMTINLTEYGVGKI